MKPEVNPYRQNYHRLSPELRHLDASPLPGASAAALKAGLAFASVLTFSDSPRKVQGYCVARATQVKHAGAAFKPCPTAWRILEWGIRDPLLDLGLHTLLLDDMLFRMDRIRPLPCLIFDPPTTTQRTSLMDRHFRSIRGEPMYWCRTPQYPD